MTPRRPHTRDTLSVNLDYLIKMTETTAAQVARTADMDGKTVRAMITGANSASIDNVDKVARVFGLNGWQLIKPELRSDIESGAVKIKNASSAGLSQLLEQNRKSRQEAHDKTEILIKMLLDELNRRRVDPPASNGD